jgi:hypothetical protein
LNSTSDTGDVPDSSALSWIAGIGGASQDEAGAFGDPGASFAGASSAPPAPSASEQWPDLSAELEPARGEATGALLPAWLQDEAPSSIEQPADSSSEQMEEAPNYLPPWLQNIP